MIYVDSNALVYLLHDVKPMSTLVINALSSNDEAYTSLRTIEEATYILARIYLGKYYGVKGTHQIRETIRRHGLESLKNELATLRSLISEYNIVVLRDEATVDEIHETMIKYRLLPGDAIIALTCKHHGIGTILTFDEDFKRVPWLKVIP